MRPLVRKRSAVTGVSPVVRAGEVCADGVMTPTVATLTPVAAAEPRN